MNYLKEMGAPVTYNNEVKLLMTGHDKFVDLFENIRHARHHIHLEYFNFRNDSIANALFSLLAEKVKEGVEVRAMFDAFGNWSNNQPLKERHLKSIRAQGIEIVKFDPITFPWVNHAIHRDHRKIVVIDGKIGYTGGMNIADYYINGLPKIGKWHDMHIHLEGDAVRYLQGISSFTQLWGGAMCFRLSAFRRYGVREFWMTNVVDDCSLADRLIHLGARIRLSGDAVLMTEAREHDLGVWHHWMDRQILFLKFCIPYQWVLLGVLACLMLLPVLWAVLAVLGVLLGKLSFGWLVGVLVYAAALALVLRSWAHFQEAVFPVWRWMVAFCASACMFVWVYLGTILAEGVLWQGIWYEVGRQGRVIRMRRQK